MTEFRKPYPAFNIPLTDQEKQLLGEIVAIQGQIEFLLGLIVEHLTGVDRKANLAIMHSASLKINTHIFVTVVRSKVKNEFTREAAENIFTRMEALAKGRNDFVHAIYAADAEGTPLGFSLVSGLELQPDAEPVAIRTGNWSKRAAADLLAVRDEAALISQELSLVRLYIHSPNQGPTGPQDASPDKSE